MIVILEGIDNVGKTMIADNLSHHYNFDWIRMFSKDKPNESLSSIEKELIKFNMPVNDFYEDLIICEILSQIKIDLDVVLDRSYPSGIVYRKLHSSWSLSEGNDNVRFVPEKITDFWYERMNKMGALYVWIEASYEVVSERISKDKTAVPMAPETYHFLEKEFRKQYDLAIKHNLYTLRLSGEELPSENVQRILEKIGR